MTILGIFHFSLGNLPKLPEVELAGSAETVEVVGCKIVVAGQIVVADRMAVAVGIDAERSLKQYQLLCTESLDTRSQTIVYHYNQVR